MSMVVEFYISRKERKNCINKLQQILDTDIYDESVHISIEMGIYDYTHQYCLSNNRYMDMTKAIYKDKLEDLIYNLQVGHPSIQKIMRGIRKGRYNAYNLAFLDPQELDEDMWMKIMVRRANTEDKLNNLPTVPWVPCRICKTNEYFYYQLQTRSADEPMTIFYICKKCKNKESVNN